NNKQAGIQFVGLTAEARRFIRTWISAHAACVGFQSQIDRTREEQTVPLELPNPAGPGTAAPAPSDGPRGFHEAAALAAATARTFDSAYENTRAPGARAAASGSEKKTSSVAAMQVPRKTTFRTSLGTWSEFAALAALTVVFTFV